MAHAYATIGDLEAYSGALSPEDRKRAAALLEHSTILIDHESPVSGDLTDSQISVRKMVAVSMVTRVLRAPADVPEGAKSLGMTAGPFTRQVSFGDGPGGLYVSKRERNLLTGKRHGSGGKLGNFSVLGGA